MRMELQSREQKKAVSVLQGDGICISRILARESSVGQSSRVFYRSNEGVPFRWEMQPGTAKDPQQEEEVIPPICPSPLMQSLGLPLPNEAPPLKSSKIWRLGEMVKKRMKKKVRGRNEEEESSRFSSICSSSSSTFSSATSPFCCSPRNIPPILEEGNTRIYYCSLHKNAFAVEEGDLFMSRTLSAEHLDGRDDEAKRWTWKKGWFWIRRGSGCGKKESIKMQQHEISFRYNEKCCADADADADASLPKTASRGRGWRVSKIRRNLEGSLLRSTRELLVFARRKWKSLAS